MRKARYAVKASRPVLYPCLAVAALGIFAVLELLVWRVGRSYPDALVQVRYVDNINRLTPQAMREICNQPLTTPALVRSETACFCDVERLSWRGTSDPAVQ